MKKIVVSAASLRMGGAITIYNQFISHLRDEIGNDLYYIFVNKVLQQPLIPGVQYHVIDIESRSRRNWFDNIGCKEVLDKVGFAPDLVVSLQNTGVRCFKGIKQLIYYHQSLPFYKHHWNPLKKEERSKFLYKHFYLWFVKRSIGPNTQFVVQTQFIKDNLVKRLGIEESQVSICFPDIEIPDAERVSGYAFPNNEFALIYPSLYSPHKSHGVLVKALGLLKNRHSELFKRVRIYFTVCGGEAPEIEQLIKSLGLEDKICLMGRLPYETTLSLYKTATAMLFPSTMETIGLPLLEAASFGLPVVVTEAPYAHEVLEGYEGVSFARAEDVEAWAKSIVRLISHCPKRFLPFKPAGKAGWHDFFEMI